MTAVEVDDVTVRYGSTIALDRFSIEVESGRILAVVGPSGSGKSTLLRAIAGLEPLAGGRILLDGRDLAGVPTHRRGLGLMFQDQGLFSHLDVAGNIEYGLRLQRVDRRSRRARVAELLELVGLEGFGSRRIDQLSGGEAQRVALARALAPRPGLLMLDEPLGSLDRALRRQLTEDLRRLLSEMGQTALHVTHDQAEAFALADRVAVLAAGRLLAQGEPGELWADPGSRFVAEFLGHPNLWTVDCNGTAELTWDGRSLGRPSAADPVGRLGPGRHTVVVPVTALSVGPATAGEAGLRAVVTEVAFRQGRYRVTARVEGDGDGASSALVHLDTATPPAVGDAVRIEVDLARLRPLVE